MDATTTQDADAPGYYAGFYELEFPGAATGRDVTVLAAPANFRYNLSGSNWTISNITGLRVQQQGACTSCTITESNGLRIETPNASNPSANHFALRILNQNGIGSGVGEAIRIDSQTSDAARGNVRFAGGNYDNGHLVFDDLHLWLDEANQRLQYEIGVPTADNDGFAVVTPSSTDTLTNKSLDGDGTGNAIMIPDGATGIASATENIAIDDSNEGAISFYDGGSAAVRYLHAEHTKCLMIEDLAATDDNLNIFWTRRPVKILSFACTDTSATTPTVSFTDSLGVAITPSPTCGATPTWSDVSADADGTLGANEGLEMDTGTAADAGSWVTICFTYRFDAP
jgi:hypothetical protein